MRSLRLIGFFMRASIQEEAAYRANFWISLLHSLLNLAAGVLGVWVLFGQVEMVHGWTFGSTLAVLGVYLTAGALRNLFIGPSLDALAGMDGEVWSGRLDFTLLRPVDLQFLASFRRWRMFGLFDLFLGMGVILAALLELRQGLDLANLAAFAIAVVTGVAVLYAILLAFTALIFWSPGVMFGWIFDGVFQLARYPVGIYPGWLRFVLTWIIPIGLITTLPAQALTGATSGLALFGAVALAVGLVVGASIFFRVAVRRYSSASS